MNTLTATPTTPRLCGCGCGANVTRRYRPGHDAKHKSNLGAALRGSWHEATEAAEVLADQGWDHLADLADLRAVPFRQVGGRPTTHVDEVTRWQVDHLGVCHADRRCRHLTTNAKAAGGINATTKLASDTYITFRDATPEEALRLRGSWDQCATCTHIHTRDEEAEHRHMTLLVTEEITYRPKGRRPRPSRAKATPTPTAPTALPSTPWNPTPLAAPAPTARPVSTDRPLTVAERADAILDRLFGR